MDVVNQVIDDLKRAGALSSTSRIVKQRFERFWSPPFWHLLSNGQGRGQ